MNYSLLLGRYSIFQSVFILHVIFSIECCNYCEIIMIVRLFTLHGNVVKTSIVFFYFLHSFNGVTMYDIQAIHIHLYLDASQTALVGPFVNFVCTLPLPPYYHSHSIVHSEILNVVVSLNNLGSITF